MYDYFYKLSAILAYLFMRFIEWVPTNSNLRNSLQNISSTVASFFDGDKGVPLGELVSGVLLSHDEDGEKYLKTTGESRPAWMVNPEATNENWKLVNRFVELAVGMYTYPAYLFQPNPLIALKTLLYLRFVRFFEYRGIEIVGDGAFYKKTAAFLASSNTKISDLHFSSFLNGVCQTPFVIVTDRPTESIVIAIRGSASLADWITDASLGDRDVPQTFRQGQWLELFNDYNKAANVKNNEVHVHGGIFLCAIYIYGEAIRLLSPLKDADESEFANYKIVVTGHSLGAGVTSLLTLLLKQTYPNEDVRGYAFSPPGCMVSENVLQKTKECVFSFVVGDDVVPRLSYHSMYDMKVKINTKISEAKAQSNGSAQTGLTNGQVKPYTPDHCGDKEVHLFAPGHILHFKEDKTTGVITSRWITPDSLQHIVLSNYLLADHMAKRVERVVKNGKHVIDRVPLIGKLPLVTRIVKSLY